jgi:hypothetical protein
MKQARLLRSGILGKRFDMIKDSRDIWRTDPLQFPVNGFPPPDFK